MSYGEATLTTEPLSSTTIKYCSKKQPLNNLNNLSQITTQDSMLDQSRSSDIEQSRNDSTTNDLIIFNRSLSISNDQSIYLFNTTCFNNDECYLLHSTKIQDTNRNDSLENHLILLLKQNIQYFCISNYEAIFVDDLTVNAGQPIQILKDNIDDEWFFVQVCDKKGYVPKNIVANINSYLNQLKKQTSTMSLPIQV
jgi:hypothetical protein